MEREYPASIFELLTAKNPDINNIHSKSKTQHSDPLWHTPKQLQKWTDFNFSSLKSAYGGKLLEVARQIYPSRLEYPKALHPHELHVENEPGTVHIYTRWNQLIVNDALYAVAEQFNATIWNIAQTKRVFRLSSSSRSLGGRSTPARDCKRAPTSTPIPAIIYADGCATTASELSSGMPPPKNKDWLPKDYKTYSKWKTEDVEAQLDDDGKVGPRARKSLAMQPIRQLYNYCIRLNCRYGCILTTGEVFIFRLRPRCEIRPQDPSTAKITWSLINDGLMEYVSIPWDRNSGEHPETFEEFTVNLALWFVHILAGNGHEPDWTYGSLADASLALSHYQTPADTPTTEPITRPSTRSPERQGNFSPSLLGKRKVRDGDDGGGDDENEDSGEDDNPAFSFTEDYIAEGSHRSGRRKLKSSFGASVHTESDGDEDESRDDEATVPSRAPAQVARPLSKLRSGRLR